MLNAPNAIITNGLNCRKACATTNLIVGPFGLSLCVAAVEPTPTPQPTPTPTAVPGGGGGVARPYEEDNRIPDSTVTFKVRFKGKTKTKTINIDNEKALRIIARMKRLQNYRWKPKSMMSKVKGLWKK